MEINVNNDQEAASQELQDQRQDLCNSCENYNSNNDECNQCDCIIARKKFYLDSQCPIGKW